MKKMLIIGALAVAAASGLANAGTIKLETTSLNGGNGGGAFKATSLTGFNGVTDGLSQFLTFCVEKNETFVPNGTYTAVVNTMAVGAYGTDPLSAKTAFLYSNYRAGTLAGFNVASSSHHGKLQEARWALEGDMTAFAPGVNQFYDLALASNWTDIGNVRVLNLFQYDQQGNVIHRQDQLTLVPLPPAAWAGLATLGGLAIARRRKMR